MLSTKTWPDGITRTHVLSKKYHGSKRTEPSQPAPCPMPQFEPAVPLPVLAPSAEEQKAVREMSFDERFSEHAVSARVAAIQEEAAEMRRTREQA